MAMGPSATAGYVSGSNAANTMGISVDTQYSSKISNMSSTKLAHNTTGVEQNMVNSLEHIGPNFGKAIVARAMNPVENKYNSLALPETYKPATRFPLAETIRSQVDNDPLYSIKGPEMEPQNTNVSFENSSVIIDSNNPDNKNDRPYTAYSKPYSNNEESREINPLKKKDEDNPLYKIKSMVKALGKKTKSYFNKSYDSNSGKGDDGLKPETIYESKGIAAKVNYFAQKLKSYVQNNSYDAKPESEDSSGYDSESVFNLPIYILHLGYLTESVKNHKSGSIDYDSMPPLEDIMKPIGLKPVETDIASLEDRLVALMD